MAGFFKGLAKGLLYFLFFPFGLIAIALYAVFGLFVFIFQFIKMIVLFFSGRNLQSDLPEDIEVKKIIEMKNPKPEEEKEDKELSMSLYPSDSIVYGGGYSSPAVEDKKEDEQEQEESSLEEFEEDESIDDDFEREEEDDNA